MHTKHLTTEAENSVNNVVVIVVVVLPVVICDEIDGDSQVPVTAGAPDPVQIRLGVLGEVKVDDHVYRLNVNASCE